MPRAAGLQYYDEWEIVMRDRAGEAALAGRVLEAAA